MDKMEGCGSNQWKPGDLNGAAEKFLVIKLDDLQELSPHVKEALRIVLDKVTEVRHFKGKPKSNKYIVINTDEPYAEQIAEIMKQYGH